jgi:hypothetical protein
LLPDTVIEVPPSPTVNGWTRNRPSLIWNWERIARIVGSSRMLSLVSDAIFSSAGKSLIATCEVWSAPLPLSWSKSGIMSLPSPPVRCRSVLKLPRAYLATGASRWMVTSCLKADGMSIVCSLRPTSKVGLAGVVVS